MQFHVYFGEGKGKTTAALGQGLRSWGAGWRVLVVQFLKDASDFSGEQAAAGELGRRWRLMRSRLPCRTIRKPTPAEERSLRRVTVRLHERALAAMKHRDLVILDEMLAAWKLGLLRVKDIEAARATASREGVRLLVATGRWAPASIIRRADVVTEMRKIRHPFDRGGAAREGIDF